MELLMELRTLYKITVVNLIWIVTYMLENVVKQGVVGSHTDFTLLSTTTLYGLFCVVFLLIHETHLCNTMAVIPTHPLMHPEALVVFNPPPSHKLSVQWWQYQTPTRSIWPIIPTCISCTLLMGHHAIEIHNPTHDCVVCRLHVCHTMCMDDDVHLTCIFHEWVTGFQVSNCPSNVHNSTSSIPIHINPHQPSQLHVYMSAWWEGGTYETTPPCCTTHDLLTPLKTVGIHCRNSILWKAITLLGKRFTWWKHHWKELDLSFLEQVWSFQNSQN